MWVGLKASWVPSPASVPPPSKPWHLEPRPSISEEVWLDSGGALPLGWRGHFLLPR